jgi:hypothetical protein
VIPVTSVVTEIQWGPDERAEILFEDGRRDHVPLDRIGSFITESHNPENSKQVARVRVELPSMDRYQGIRFVDTPGLESVFEHNTEAALEWLPNVGLALVAVGVDPPLSQHDIELIRNLSRYTPNISLLLTKVDVLDEGERDQVLQFVRKQLARHWNDAIPVFPYSVRPGFEHLRADLNDSLLSQVRADAGEHRTEILLHKFNSLSTECAGYLNVALKAAEVADSERKDLSVRILGQKESLDDARLALLQPEEGFVKKKLAEGLDQEFPSWTRSLRVVIEKFDHWLGVVLTRDMAELSQKHRDEFVEPVRRVSRQLSQSLQDFRNRISERMLESVPDFRFFKNCKGPTMSRNISRLLALVGESYAPNR